MQTDLTTPFSTLRRALALAAALGLATLGASHARAQANLTFSGGGNAAGASTPLTMTLNAPVTYVITTAYASYLGAPVFVFPGVGNKFDFRPDFTSTLTFTVNGGPAQPITYLYSGFNDGAITADAAYISGATPGVAVGDTVVLNAGSMTTTAPYPEDAPASGSYQTLITDGAGDRLDALNGVAVAPEPSTWALLAVGTAALGLTALRRRAARA